MCFQDSSALLHIWILNSSLGPHGCLGSLHLWLLGAMLLSYPGLCFCMDMSFLGSTHEMAESCDNPKCNYLSFCQVWHTQGWPLSQLQQPRQQPSLLVLFESSSVPMWLLMFLFQPPSRSIFWCVWRCSSKLTCSSSGDWRSALFHVLFGHWLKFSGKMSVRYFGCF